MVGDGPLEFAVADLNDDAGWADAVAGCAFVLHVASPFPLSQPKHEDDLIVPARDGALRVLRAARDAGVQRVVLTSSFAAIGYGHRAHEGAYDETDWTDVDGRTSAPTRSPRRSPSARRGTSSSARAARSSSRRSTRSPCSARCWGPTRRRRSSWSSG